MVKFGKTLKQEQNKDYKSYYIDYNGLKRQIKQMVLSFESEQDQELLNSQIRAFLNELDYEISKAAVFYEELVEDIARSVASIRKKWPFMSPETLPFVYNQTKETANSIGECMKFLELNVEGTRKILKKAEKLTQSDVVSKDNFLKERLRPDTLDSKLLKLRVHQGMEGLIDEVKDRINKMRQYELEWLENGFIDKRFSTSLHRRQDTQELVNSMYTTTKRALKHTQWYYGFLNQAQIDYESEPVGLADSIGLFLNNANTFLYMANYYIVIPTANEYADAIGMSKTSSGYLLAMTPLSSLFASALYSKWSNRSFRNPLMFCTLLLFVGNLLYAIALNYQSPSMLFAGRLVVGLGGNRAINRRYIADFVSVERRTFHSAMFVAIGSLGMSFGPGIQPALSLLNFTIPIVNWKVNHLTAPGWALLLLWVFFFFLVLFLFHEPERKYAQQRVAVPLKPLLEHDFFGDTAIHKGKATPHFAMKARLNIPPARRVNIVATTICLWIYFVLKLTQEALQSAAPLVTALWFGWSDSSVAYLLGGIGLIVLPANLAIGYVGRGSAERLYQFVSLVAMAMGCLICLIFSDNFSVYQYVIGVGIAFLAAQALEAVNMGLLSKVMPKKMSKGLLNSGFLSTEAGTLGRAIGNIFISIAGLFGIRYLQNMVVIPCMSLICLSLVILILSWKILVPAVELLSNLSQNQANTLLRPSFGMRDGKLLPLALCLSLDRGSDVGPVGEESSLNDSPKKTFQIKCLSESFISRHSSLHGSEFEELPYAVLDDRGIAKPTASQAQNVSIHGSLSDSTYLRGSSQAAARSNRIITRLDSFENLKQYHTLDH